MKRTRTSRAWMAEHVNDGWVQKAKAEGYRSRAAYKLLEIDERDGLLMPGAVVVDLGAAPGSWSQVAARKVAPRGRVIALDLLEFEPLENVEFIQGDFQEDDVLRRLETTLEGAKVDVVLSDMAPNMSGIELVDQARSVQLAELALEFARDHLKPGGRCLFKLFQGQGFMEFRNEMAQSFRKVQVRKPKASRGRSAEVYLCGQEFYGDRS